MNAGKYIIPKKERQIAAAGLGIMLKFRPETPAGEVIEKATYAALRNSAMKEYGRRIVDRLDRYLGFKKMMKNRKFDSTPQPAVYRIYGALNAPQRIIVMRKVLKRLRNRQNGIRKRAIEDIFDELVREAINELSPEEKKALEERWQ